MEFDVFFRGDNSYYQSITLLFLLVYFYLQWYFLNKFNTHLLLVELLEISNSPSCHCVLIRCHSGDDLYDHQKFGPKWKSQRHGLLNDWFLCEERFLRICDERVLQAIRPSRLLCVRVIAPVHGWPVCTTDAKSGIRIRPAVYQLDSSKLVNSYPIDLLDSTFRADIFDYRHCSSSLLWPNEMAWAGKSHISADKVGKFYHGHKRIGYEKKKGADPSVR